MLVPCRPGDDFEACRIRLKAATAYGLPCATKCNGLRARDLGKISDLAVNVWHSNGAGIRNDKRAGLDWFAMQINDQPTIDGVKKRLDAAGITIDSIPGGFAAADPWGTFIRFTIAP